MDINVYLPDELGARAKAADLKFSRLLRDAVERELEHSEELARLRESGEAHELDVDTGDGVITVRLHAHELEWDGDSQWLYRTADDRVLAYDADGRRLCGFDFEERDPLITITELEEWRYGDQGFYRAILLALDEDAVIDIGA